MAAFWHSLSTILLDEPRCFATPQMVSLLAHAEGEVRLVYAGDRMWPAVSHGTVFTVRATDAEIPEVGSAVLVSVEGLPDLLRVESVNEDSMALVADADPQLRVRVAASEVIGVAAVPPAQGGRRRGRWRLDLAEAWHARPDAEEDPADTVREKYESQAANYAREDRVELEGTLAERIRSGVLAGGKILVIGSGAGRECFALAALGFRVVGVDFAPTMVAHAQEAARRRGVPVSFEVGDARVMDLPGDLAGVLFTYDVYSFVPEREQRIRLLCRLGSRMRRDGLLFLSARRLGTPYQRLILTLQHAARRGAGEWGDTHTRWIAADGSIRRSYVRVFTAAGLRRELNRGGFRHREWAGGHGTYVKAGS